MPGPGTQDVTGLLELWSSGDKSALDQLWPLVQDELRRVALAHLNRERRGHTLQPTALVNEAYLRLAGQARFDCQGRTRFFALATHIMRHVLVNHAVQRRAVKRGGGNRVPLDEVALAVAPPELDLVTLDQALDKLARRDPRKARIVELRFFAGLNETEIGELLEISPTTVKRDWRIARALLYDNLRPGHISGEAAPRTK